jgi:phosphoribosylformimino-5-aminoimidazole carboxamide ribotide isomerase
MIWRNHEAGAPFEPIPAIDLLGGRVVRLAQGDYERVTIYSDDPFEVARRWVDEGATRLHVVDLEGARAGAPVQSELVRQIVASAGVPCQVAGGIRTEAAAALMLEAGADRVVLGSALVRAPAMAGRLVSRHGAGSIVAAIDVRDGSALGEGWVAGAVSSDALQLAAALSEAGVRWMAVTAIARDGLLGGPDLELLESVGAAAPASAIIASAGVTSVADVETLAARGFAGAILGRALYEGRLSLGAALAQLGRRPGTDADRRR